MEALRHAGRVQDFGAVFFRRNSTQVRNQGGLWDASMKVYPLVRGAPVKHNLEWHFPLNGMVKFCHLEHDTTVLSYQGSEICLICFDELTHFTESQFWYMFSRNRSMCGVKPYIRASTNPDADSWVLTLISWWIGDDGFPIKGRAGVVRWFIRQDDVLLWGDSGQELRDKYGAEVMPKSLTFVPALITDNQALLAKDPGYLANLMAMDSVSRGRLLDGNWKIRPKAGEFFREEWVRWYDPATPPAYLQIYGFSDYAVTDGGGDYTEHGILGVSPNDDIVLLDWWSGQTNSAEWIEAQLDLVNKWKPLKWVGEAGPIRRAIEPFLERRMRERRDYCQLEWLPSIANKPTRARAIQSRAAMGKIYYPTGTPWAQRLIRQMSNFPGENTPDDAVDVLSLAGRTLDTLNGGRVPTAKPKITATEAALARLRQRSTGSTGMSA